jgi:hypothetical protein
MLQIVQFILFIVAGIAAAAGFSGPVVTPVSAQSGCQDGSNVVVEFLGIGTSNTILMAQLDNYYQGDIRVRVFCNEGTLPLVTNAEVALSTDVPSSEVLVNGVWKPASGAEVLIALPTGEGVVSLRTTQPGLPVNSWKARVGEHTVVVTQAYGSAVPGGYPNATGGVWAQTPELDSMLLLGAGLVLLAAWGARQVRSTVRR